MEAILIEDPNFIKKYLIKEGLRAGADSEISLNLGSDARVGSVECWITIDQKQPIKIWVEWYDLEDLAITIEDIFDSVSWCNLENYYDKDNEVSVCHECLQKEGIDPLSEGNYELIIKPTEYCDNCWQILKSELENWPAGLLIV